jgi:hypothetical protein
VSTPRSRVLEDVKVGVRLKMSALWIATLFLFAYGDIFGFFKPGQIGDVISGQVSGIEITQVCLLGASVYIAIASVMIFLSLVSQVAKAPTDLTVRRHVRLPLGYRESHRECVGELSAVRSGWDRGRKRVPAEGPDGSARGSGRRPSNSRSGPCR